MPLRDTWTAWLGPAADIITDEQLEALETASKAIDARWPDVDDRTERQDALSAAAQVILGDATLESISQEWHTAVIAEVTARAAMTGALIAASTSARSGPGSEADLINRSGASRMTVRKALSR